MSNTEQAPTVEQRLARLEEMVDIFDKHSEIHRMAMTDAYKVIDVMRQDLDAQRKELLQLREHFVELASTALLNVASRPPASSDH